MHKIDLPNWPRREKFDFFSSVSQPFYSVTFRVDVTKLHAYTRAHSLSFYYALVYLATNAANAVENFRYTVRQGEVWLLDERSPIFSIRKGPDTLNKVVSGPFDLDSVLGSVLCSRQTSFLFSSCNVVFIILHIIIAKECCQIRIVCLICGKVKLLAALTALSHTAMHKVFQIFVCVIAKSWDQILVILAIFLVIVDIRIQSLHFLVGFILERSSSIHHSNARTRYRLLGAIHKSNNDFSKCNMIHIPVIPHALEIGFLVQKAVVDFFCCQIDIMVVLVIYIRTPFTICMDRVALSIHDNNTSRIT